MHSVLVQLYVRGDFALVDGVTANVGPSMPHPHTHTHMVVAAGGCVCATARDPNCVMQCCIVDAVVRFACLRVVANMRAGALHIASCFIGIAI